MNSLRVVFLFVSLVFSVASASAPSVTEQRNADYGPYPDDYQQIIKNFYGGIMKDPYSIRYENITEPRKGWVSGAFSSTKYGYLVCVTLNAKNSYGAYTGAQTDGLIIYNGVIVSHRQGNGKEVGRKTGCN